MYDIRYNAKKNIDRIVIVDFNSVDKVFTIRDFAMLIAKTTALLEPVGVRDKNIGVLFRDPVLLLVSLFALDCLDCSSVEIMHRSSGPQGAHVDAVLTDTGQQSANSVQVTWRDVLAKSDNVRLTSAENFDHRILLKFPGVYSAYQKSPHSAISGSSDTAVNSAALRFPGLSAQPRKCLFSGSLEKRVVLFRVLDLLASGGVATFTSGSYEDDSQLIELFNVSEIFVESDFVSSYFECLRLGRGFLQPVQAVHVFGNNFDQEILRHVNTHVTTNVFVYLTSSDGTVVANGVFDSEREGIDFLIFENIDAMETNEGYILYRDANSTGTVKATTEWSPLGVKGKVVDNGAAIRIA